MQLPSLTTLLLLAPLIHAAPAPPFDQAADLINTVKKVGCFKGGRAWYDDKSDLRDEVRSSIKEYCSHISEEYWFPTTVKRGCLDVGQNTRVDIRVGLNGSPTIPWFSFDMCVEELTWFVDNCKRGGKFTYEWPSWDYKVDPNKGRCPRD